MDAYRLLMERTEVKGSVGRPRGRWVNNITTDFAEIGRRGVNWTDLAQGRHQCRAGVNTVMKLGVL
jgi:hypothetical protein